MKKRVKSNPLIMFRCWSRKRYGAFNSIGKIVKICTLCIAYNIVGAKSECMSQIRPDSLAATGFEIGEVVVKGGGAEDSEPETEVLILKVEKAEIGRSPAGNVADILRYSTGVDIRQRGPQGVQSDISIRGGTFDQTMILLNGINITDSQSGHHNLNLPLPFESIERIEIMNASTAMAFGTGALNGAINIITGNKGTRHINTSFSYGQNNLLRASATLSAVKGRINHFLSINRSSSDGYMPNTDFNNTSFYYQAGYKLPIGVLDFQTGYNTRNFAANSFYSLRFPNQYEATKTEFASLRYQTGTRVKISAAAYVRRNRDRFELRRDTLPYNHHLTNTSGLNINVSAGNRRGKTTIGIDLRNEHIISNVLGITLNNPIPVNGYNDIYYTKYYNRFNTGFYLEHTLNLNRFNISSAVMASYYNGFKGIRLYPCLDISYNLDDIRIYSSLSRSMRTPTFTDLFYRSPVQQANRTLRPEEAVSAELGIKYLTEPFTGSISIFRREGHRMIDWVKSQSADSTIWRSMNYGSISFSGAETEISYSPGNSENHILSSIRLSYSYLRSEKPQSDLISKYVFDYLKHKVSIAVDLRIGRNLYLSNRIAYSDRNGTFQDKQGLTTDYRPFWLFDSKLFVKTRVVTFYTEVTNIFDEKYNDFGGIEQPGRWLTTGLEFDFDYMQKKSGKNQ